jgi:hypothetical protein
MESGKIAAYRRAGVQSRLRARAETAGTSRERVIWTRAATLHELVTGRSLVPEVVKDLAFLRWLRQVGHIGAARDGSVESVPASTSVHVERPASIPSGTLVGASSAARQGVRARCAACGRIVSTPRHGGSPEAHHDPMCPTRGIARWTVVAAGRPCGRGRAAGRGLDVTVGRAGIGGARLRRRSGHRRLPASAILVIPCGDSQRCVHFPPRGPIVLLDHPDRASIDATLAGPNAVDGCLKVLASVDPTVQYQATRRTRRSVQGKE